MQSSMKGDGHHVAQAEGRIQRYLGNQQLSAVIHNDGIAVEKQNQRPGQQDIRRCDQHGQQKRALERKANRLMEAILLFGTKGIGSNRLILIA